MLREMQMRFFLLHIAPHLPLLFMKIEDTVQKMEEEKSTSCRCWNKLANILTYTNIFIFPIKFKALLHKLTIVLCFVHTLKMNVCSGDC